MLLHILLLCNICYADAAAQHLLAANIASCYVMQMLLRSIFYTAIFAAQILLSTGPSGPFSYAGPAALHNVICNI